MIPRSTNNFCALALALNSTGNVIKAKREDDPKRNTPTHARDVNCSITPAINSQGAICEANCTRGLNTHGYPAVAEHYEEGVGLRRKTSRKKHADLLGPIDRDPVAILARGDRTRVPELVPVRYERMLTSPFAFLRGAASTD